MDIDFSNRSDIKKDEGRAKIRNSHYDIKMASNISDKAERMRELKKIFIDILRDEIETRKIAEIEKQPSYKATPEGMEGFMSTMDMVSQEQSLNMKRDQEHLDAYKFSPNYENIMSPDGSDEFLVKYDEVDDELTGRILEYLHENPHLFRKLKFFQRNNKVFNTKEVPELESLRNLKNEVVSALYLYSHSWALRRVRGRIQAG